MHLQAHLQAANIMTQSKACKRACKQPHGGHILNLSANNIGWTEKGMPLTLHWRIWRVT